MPTCCDCQTLAKLSFVLLLFLVSNTILRLEFNQRSTFYLHRGDTVGDLSSLSSSSIIKLNHSFVSSSIILNESNSSSIHSNQAKYPIHDTPSRPTSRYAYVTLLHGIDNSKKYKGFLLNTLIINKALRKLNSKYDFLVLLGFSSTRNSNSPEIESDLHLLRDAGIIVRKLNRLVNFTTRASFAEMALQKIIPWSFVEYERVQFFDGDILPLSNMDCFFSLSTNTFNSGSASPLNSGWFLAVPNQTMYESLVPLSMNRLATPWNESLGWGTEIPSLFLYFRGQKRPVESWNFNGASLDQGLLTHHFLLNEGGATILDTQKAILFLPQRKKIYQNVREIVNSCDKRLPIESFAHFTGRNKPWLRNPLDPKHSSDKHLLLWYQYLDELQLSINSSTISKMDLRSPLGYFHPNK